MRALLLQQRQLRWQVVGNSMVPTFPHGSEIVVVPIARPPRLGEVLLVWLGEEVVVHRLVARRGGQLVTQGDGLPAPDRPIRLEEVIGRVVQATFQGTVLWPRRGVPDTAWVLRYQLLRGWRLVRRWRRKLG